MISSPVPLKNKLFTDQRYRNVLKASTYVRERIKIIKLPDEKEAVKQPFENLLARVPSNKSMRG